MKEEIMPSQALVDFEVKKPNGSEALAVTSPTPMDLLQTAIIQDVSIEKLSQLMELQLKWEANEARKAFVSDLNAFKAATPVLEKVKKVDFSSKGGNRVNYNYAPLDHVSKVLGEALSRHGLSFRWNVQQGDLITVTCILQHRQGHTESVSMSSGLHNDERMNPIQRLGSTITYLERYTLLAATGMATQEQDTDGNGPTFGELNERLEWIANCATLEELQRVFAAAYKEAKASGSNGALQALANAKDKKKRELQ